MEYPLDSVAIPKVIVSISHFFILPVKNKPGLAHETVSLE